MENIAPVFDTFVKSLQEVVAQIQDEELASKIVEKEEFNLATYWEHTNALVKALSAEATKLCMTFSQPPIPEPEEYQPILKRVEAASMSLLATSFSLPLSQGITMRRLTLASIVGIVKAVQTLCETIQKEGCQGCKNQLQRTGNVWECCERFPSLPRDNKVAVKEKAEESLVLVNDALQEIEEAQSENMVDDDFGDEQVTWSDAERPLLAPALGLVKTAKAVLKKTSQVISVKGQCDAPQRVSELDLLAQRLQPVSPAVDELVTCLYPPLQAGHVRSHSQELYEVTKNLLSTIRQTHLIGAEDGGWVDFLLKAADHNWGKVQVVIPAV